MKYFFALLFLFSFHIVFSQDTVYFKNDSSRIVNIEVITAAEIKYHTFDNLNGPLYTVNTKGISKIIFKSGLIQFFSATENHTSKNEVWIDPTPTKKRTIPFFDNRYGPFHQKIKDEANYNRIVSKFGCYFSVGLGAVGCHNNSGFAQIASFSYAYKSHLISFSGGHFSNVLGEPVSGYSYCNGSYYGVLLGESLRLKWLLLSGSIGIGYTSVDFYSYPNSSYSSTPPSSFEVSNKVSMPIEFKLFYTAPVNGIGVGIHICEDVLSLSQHAASSPYSCFYFGVCIVTGFWNSSK